MLTFFSIDINLLKTLLRVEAFRHLEHLMGHFFNNMDKLHCRELSKATLTSE